MDKIKAAREALAAFEASGQRIVADRLMGKRRSAPMNRLLPNGAAHLRAALEEIDRLSGAPAVVITQGDGFGKLRPKHDALCLAAQMMLDAVCPDEGERDEEAVSDAYRALDAALVRAVR
jgi:hypothetical protein